MFKFTVGLLIKEQAKSTWMTYYFWLDSEVCTPWEKTYERKLCDATNACRSHDNDNMANIVCPGYIHTTLLKIKVL